MSRPAPATVQAAGAGARRRALFDADGLQQLTWSLRWRVHGVRPGAHRGVGSGRLGELRTLVPLDRSPDVRRIDLRASLRDPFQRWYVREYTPRTAARVCMLVDLSGSMGFADGRRELVNDLCRAIAFAARRNGDAFALYVCDHNVREQASRPAWARPNPEALFEAIESEQAEGGYAEEGLEQAARRLGMPRKLVFVVSDFEFPEDAQRRLCEALSRHDVIPIQLGADPLAQLPEWGLAELNDLETGRQRLLWLRPALLRRWRAQAKARADALLALYARFGWRILPQHGALDLERLAGHLMVR